MTLPLVALSLLFVTWFLATVACNFERVGQRIRRLDVLHLVPEWRFFAPRPATEDVRLLYRDYFGESMVGPWTEARLLSPRRWWHGAWNPAKRQNKTLFDALSALNVWASRREQLPFVSIPYLMVLNYLSRFHRTLPCTRVQFAVVMSGGRFSDGQIEPLFVSTPHSLGTGSSSKGESHAVIPS